MYVNDDLTIRSPIDDIVDGSYDLWTRIKRALTAAKPDTVLLIDHSSGISVSIQEFLTKVDYIAANLVRHGFNRTIPVTIAMANCLEYIYVVCAAWHLGGFSSTVNVMSTPADITKYLHLLESDFVFCDDQTAPMVVSGAEGTRVTKIFVNGTHPGCIPMASLLNPTPLSTKDTKTLSPSDVALIQFSSGTTGFPKAVELTHFGLTKWFAGMLIPETGLSVGNYALIYQPFSHIYGMALVTATLISARPGIIMKRFDMEEYIKCVVKYKVDKLFFVPPLAVMFTKGDYTKRYDLSHVTELFCGAAPLGDDVIDTLLKQMGNQVQVRQLYGMTECAGTYCPPRKYVANVPKHAVGFPFPATKFKVIDITTGVLLGPLKQGEICVYTKAKMKGYLKNKKATEEMIDKDGWLHTGDIGYYDKVGYIYIVDRLKELIKYKGLQVPPAELENVLLSHPDIADSGVTGLPDELAGELPFAYVVLKPGKTVTAEDVHAFVNERVAKYKQLRGGIKFVSQIPKSPSGKILRRIIKMEQTGKATAKL